jgi:hypothetical protein
MIFNCTSKSIRPKKNDLEDNRIGRLNSMGLIYLKEYFLPKEKKIIEELALLYLIQK